jgi:dTDP-4-amino-4,6-dideoxygalactose transaminase
MQHIPLSEPHVGELEIELVMEALRQNWVGPVGPMLERFEADFCALTGFPHCVAVSSGSAAMHLAMLECGVGPGDEVLATTLTFIASVAPAVHLGAKPVFIDIDAETWNMDPQLTADELHAAAQRGKLPKAVIPTDLYGQCADLETLRQICAPYGVPVVADCAESVGSRLQAGPRNGDAITSTHHTGLDADLAIFSFNSNKIITTSGGGILAGHDASIVAHARKMANQAREPVAHYEHTAVGHNFRMSAVAAAIGIGQLSVLQQRVAQRRHVYERYAANLQGLPGVRLLLPTPGTRPNHWLTVIQVEPEIAGTTREALSTALARHGIETRPVWKPMHMQPVFSKHRTRGGERAAEVFRKGLCLPSSSTLTDDTIDDVSGRIRSFVASALLSVA